MWTYLLRRLLLIIPTMIGVTVVSFAVMQFAPGDPELVSANSSGERKAEQTQELYQITRRSLFLDKPLLLNTRYFTDYRPALRETAYFLTVPIEELSADLERWRTAPTPEDRAHLDFVRGLRGRRFEPLVTDFGTRLADPEQHRGLAAGIRAAVVAWLNDVGPYGVMAALELLEDETLPRQDRVGLTQILGRMILAPQKKNFSVHATLDEAEREVAPIEALWTRWRDLQPATEPATPARQAELRRFVLELTVLDSPEAMNTELGRRYDVLRDLTPADKAALVGLLVGEDNLRVKQVVAAVLATVVATPLTLAANERSTDEQLATVVGNWRAIAASRRAEYDYDLATRIGGLFVDTQYARMVGRLITFQFGTSATKTREDVGAKLWAAAEESVPLMLAAELVIYVFAIPLGILCGVKRGTAVDRGVSAGLFLLYSIPPAVAAMLMLITLCYRLQLFPSARLHGDNAENLNLFWYSVDFLHHATLPVICLSLFSLASMAMYSRSSILEVLGQDYIRTARAKGVRPSRVIGKHAFRNSLIPILTLFSNFLPALLGGSVIIEVLFDINGLGKLGWDSITQKDFPTQMALLYISALVVMLSILMTDLLYVVADPRIKLGRQE